MNDLNGVRVAVLATDGVEESELTDPVRALVEAGAHVHVVSPKEGDIETFRHFDRFGTVPVDRALEAVEADDYDALLLPGGAFNADQLRMESRARELIRVMMKMGRPVAAICHAPWELISAGVARGRKMTGYRTIEDDVRNAGGLWEDEEVVIDGNLITSRQPSDLHEFIVEMLRVFGMLARPKPPGPVDVEVAEPKPAGRKRRLGSSRKGGRPARRRVKSPGTRMGGRAPGPAES
jgi:protease I